MQFLDNIILGYNTPRYTDGTQFPSRTYRRTICKRKHCDATCATRSCPEPEFWAYVLSEKGAEKVDVRKNIHAMNEDLRFSVWIKCCGLFVEFEAVNYGRRRLGVCDESDESLVQFILDAYKDTDIGSQKDIFCIFKNLERCFPHISNCKLLILFIKYVLEHPYAKPLMVFRFVHTLVKSYNFYSIFCSLIEEDTPQEDTQSCSNDGHLKFWEILICEHPCLLDRVIDILVCHENADAAAVPDFIRKQVASDDVRSWVEFLHTEQGFDTLDSVFESQRTLKSVECEDRRETTYFDFLVVQNEFVRAQESMRAGLNERLRVLERERDKLYIQKINLTGICKSLETELRRCHEEHVDEFGRTTLNPRNRCKAHEREDTGGFET